MLGNLPIIMNLMNRRPIISFLPFCHSFMSNQLFKASNASVFASLSAKKSDTGSDHDASICIGFVGDVMLGRGIDAILPNHVDGTIYESFMRDASGYVNLAIRHTGPLPQDELKERGHYYIWGDLMETLTIPDLMVVNLETALTTSEDYAKWKGIHYRAHPLNVQSLRAFGPNSIFTLANNHVLDWGVEGLKETIATLDEAQMKHVGAGLSFDDARVPAISTIQKRQVSVVAVGFLSAGVPKQWEAGRFNNSGVCYMEEPTKANAEEIMKQIQNIDSIKVVSLHMGPNWNDKIPHTWRHFAHNLIDNGADVVVTHSSHHVKGIEVYKDRMISYGLGDFLNDYEGITGQGYEAYRQDLTCLYLPCLNVNGELQTIEIIPCKINHLKVQRATDENDIGWICSALSREGKNLGTFCEKVQDRNGNMNLRIRW